MEWKRNLQKLGRIQIPTDYLKSKGLAKGDEVLIKETEKNLELLIKIKKQKKQR